MNVAFLLALKKDQDKLEWLRWDIRKNELALIVLRHGNNLFMDNSRVFLLRSISKTWRNLCRIIIIIIIMWRCNVLYVLEAFARDGLKLKQSSDQSMSWDLLLPHNSRLRAGSNFVPLAFSQQEISLHPICDKKESKKQHPQLKTRHTHRRIPASALSHSILGLPLGPAIHHHNLTSESPAWHRDTNPAFQTPRMNH